MFVASDAGRPDTPLPPDPVFGLAEARPIRLPAPWRNTGVADCLASRVMRKPGDLLSHMQRIWLHHDMGDSAGAGAAAIDLFIAAGDKGRDLRQRVLHTFAADLRQCGCYDALHDAIEPGLSDHDPRVARRDSLLCRPVGGSFDFVRRRPAANATIDPDDPFDWDTQLPQEQNAP